MRFFLRAGIASSMGKRLKVRKYFLVDNGSFGAEAILNLRKIANSLAKSSGFEVRPMGLMHSHKVDPSALDGVAGESMEAFLDSDEANFVSDIRVVPFFLGPSLAVTDWLPRNLEKWRLGGKGRSFVILDSLYQKGDNRIARSLSGECIKEMNTKFYNKPFLVLVDHGTPVAKVNEVREQVGATLADLLKDRISGFSTCSMERRPDPCYDFNEPLLAELLANCTLKGISEILVAQLFLSPGRHAGKTGDIHEICSKFLHQNSGNFTLSRTETIGGDPLVLEILKDRIKEDNLN